MKRTIETQTFSSVQIPGKAEPFLVHTYFSISLLAFLLSKSILDMTLICGISKETIALRAAIAPEINYHRKEAGKEKEKSDGKVCDCPIPQNVTHLIPTKGSLQTQTDDNINHHTGQTEKYLADRAQ